MAWSQIQNTKQAQSDCLCTVNYLNFTHPPKTGCQNPCWNGFFIRREGARDRGRAEENKREEKKQEAERGRETLGETGRRRERGRGSEAMLACRRTLAALCSTP